MKFSHFHVRSSSSPPLIQIETVYDHEFCANKVIITAMAKEKTKKTAFVLAENLDTHEVARVDVILDKIHSIAVHTTTRELYLEEAPETFEMVAQDDQGNHFSTLEGVEFNWRIENRQQVLRFLTFSESNYHQVPKEIEKFEAMGKRGHLILLDGINSGTAKVFVRLPHNEYKTVPEVQVDIAVLANLIIEPMEANILVGDSINFKVLQLKQGKLHEIVLDEQYTLEIEKRDIAKINKGLANGLKLGTTSVILKDKNILDSSKTPMPLPKARLTVSEADKIVLNLLPYYNWVTIEKEIHDIAIDLYTKNDEKITLGSKFKIASEFDQSLFKESSRNDNGTRVHGQAVKVGTNKVTAKFANVSCLCKIIINLTFDLIIIYF
jgi:nuclear pore complex protein Nup210